MKRSEIDQKYKWDLGPIFPSDEAWEQGFAKLQALAPSLAPLKENLTKSAAALADALAKIDEASLLCEQLFVYAKMRRDEDNGNARYQAMADRAFSLYVTVSGETSYVAPTLLKESEETLLRFVEEETRLAPYAFMIRDLIRQKQHVLSEAEEKLLSMSADFAAGPRDIFKMLESVDMKFGTVPTPEGDVQLTHGKYLELMQSRDRAVRKAAFDTYYAAFRDHINTIATTYSTSVKKDVFYAKVRGYGSALEQALFGDNVPVQLYDDLIATIHESLPTMYDYIEARRKILGLEDIAMYDIYVPLVGETGTKYSYEQAMDMVTDALTPLGPNYRALLRRAFNEKWIDVFENEGKTTGAYSWGAYGSHPYVLLNHRSDIDSVYTLAHELGHAMHTYHSDETQPFPTAQYTIFVAEVASTVNELLLTRYLLEHGDEALKKHVLNHYIDQFRTTVLRQTMFAEFEKTSHAMCEAGEPLTQDTLCAKYRDLNNLYYGGCMNTCDTIALEWARLPHFYNSFYVYKYATGFSAAVMLATKLYAKEPGALDSYMEFLKSGGSDHPLNLLKKAGVDFSDGAPVKNCMAEFARALGEFKNVMGVSS
jgi:oligoendopeptidase F